MAKSKKSATKKVSILTRPLSFAIIVGAIASAIIGIIKLFIPKKK